MLNIIPTAKELLQTHDIANVRLNESGLLQANFTLKPSQSGFASAHFGGKNPISETRALFSNDDIETVKKAIDSTTPQGKGFLTILADYQAQPSETPAVETIIQRNPTRQRFGLDRF